MIYCYPRLSPKYTMQLGLIMWRVRTYCIVKKFLQQYMYLLKQKNYFLIKLVYTEIFNSCIHKMMVMKQSQTIIYCWQTHVIKMKPLFSLLRQTSSYFQRCEIFLSCTARQKNHVRFTGKCMLYSLCQLLDSIYLKSREKVPVFLLTFLKRKMRQQKSFLF